MIHCFVLALRGSYKRIEDSLPKLEDLHGAAQGLMRLQDVYALQVGGMVKGHFQQNINGKTVDVYKPSVRISLSGDDCFLVGKVGHLKSLLQISFLLLFLLTWNIAINWTLVFYGSCDILAR